MCGECILYIYLCLCINVWSKSSWRGFDEHSCLRQNKSTRTWCNQCYIDFKKWALCREKKKPNRLLFSLSFYIIGRFGIAVVFFGCFFFCAFWVPAVQLFAPHANQSVPGSATVLGAFWRSPRMIFGSVFPVKCYMQTVMIVIFLKQNTLIILLWNLLNIFIISDSVLSIVDLLLTTR